MGYLVIIITVYYDIIYYITLHYWYCSHTDTETQLFGKNPGILSYP